MRVRSTLPLEASTLAVARVLFSDVWLSWARASCCWTWSSPAWSAVSWVGESPPTWPCSDPSLLLSASTLALAVFRSFCSSS